MHLVGNGEEPLKHFYKDVLRWVNLLVIFVAEHLYASVNKKNAEYGEHPFELGYDGRTCKDEYAAQNQCSENAPE